MENLLTLVEQDSTILITMGAGKREAQADNGLKERHPIQVVARRTGLTPDVLRVWERRYEAVRPARSSGSRRLYSDDDVERLVLLRRATLGGRSIGQVASLPTDELRQLVEADESAQRQAPAAARAANSRGREESPSASLSATEHLDACLEAIRRLDVPGLEAALNRAGVSLSRTAAMEMVLMPLMHRIGDLWREGTLRIVHEHLAAAVVRNILARSTEGPLAPGSGPSLLVTTPAGQLHELGAMMVVGTAASEGWQATYLGPNLPAEEIAVAAQTRQARALALSIIYPADDPRLGAEIRLVRRFSPEGMAIIAGGAAASAYRDDLEAIGATILPDMQTLRATLEGLRKVPSRD